ncbi:MAG: alpha/beta hydrolase [Lachnospiraceae bacterium]|nr:alpha/beta hydrolase [Lachnospiraceae bacterium]
MRKRQKLLIPIFIIVILAAVFLIYTGIYYHADADALAALKTDDSVYVTQKDYGWLFDGPSKDTILVFYPGAKVEETAYAPLLNRLAKEGIDTCLVKMPFRLAFFGANRAEEILADTDYEHRYVGGHSLGGAFAAYYASGHGEGLSGVVLLAAYPTKELDDDLLLLSIYGSEDGVLNMKKVAEGRQYAPKRYVEQVIDGGNHAYFGDYGEQKGDKEAALSPEDQQRQTADWIIKNINQQDGQ